MQFMKLSISENFMRVSLAFCAFILLSTITATSYSKEKIFINYEYINDIDIGGYNTTGLSSRDLKIPISYTYKFRKDRSWGLKFKTDLNFGRYKFKGTDNENEKAKADVDAISIVPGVSLKIPIKEYWFVQPFIQFGLGWGYVTEHSPGFDAESPLTYTYSAGVKNILLWQKKRFKFRFGSALSAAANGTFDGDFKDIFAKIKFGLDVRHPLGFQIKSLTPNAGIYLSYTRYLPDTEFPLLRPNDLDVNDQYEIGVSVGLENILKIDNESKLSRKIINLPLKLLKKRIVISYRFGDGINGIIFRFKVPI